MTEWTSERLLRAWLAFACLQSLGSLFFAAKDPSIFCARLFSEAPPSAVIGRQHAFGVLLLLVMRVFLVFHSSVPLHLCHICFSVLSTLQVLSEIFLFNSMWKNFANVFTIFIAVMSVIFTLVYLYTNQNQEQAGPQPRRVGGRLFAKHFMETDVLRPPPDGEEVRELKKKL